MCVCVCLCVYACVYVNVCMCVCMYVCMCVFVCVCVYFLSVKPFSLPVQTTLCHFSFGYLEKRPAFDFLLTKPVVNTRSNASGEGKIVDLTDPKGAKWLSVSHPDNNRLVSRIQDVSGSITVRSGLSAVLGLPVWRGYRSECLVPRMRTKKKKKQVASACF